MIPALSQSVVGLFVNVPAFLQNPIVWNSVVANSFIIPVDLVGNNTNLEPLILHRLELKQHMRLDTKLS